MSDGTSKRQESRSRRPRAVRRFRPDWSLSHVVMVVAGLLTFVFIVGALRDRDTVTELGLLAVDVPRGTIIERDHVKMIPWKGAPDEVQGLIYTSAALEEAMSGELVAARPLPSGKMLLPDDLIPAAEITAPRAMSLPVPRGVAWGEQLSSGDRVDVIAFVNGTASFVVTAAEVVQVQAADGPAGSGGAIVLAVDSAASLRLAWAMGAAELQVVKVTGAPAADPTANFPALDAEVHDVRP